MRDIAVISVAQTPMRRRVQQLNEVEMLMPAIHGALDQVDMTIDDIGFTCSGSTDYLAGVGFSEQARRAHGFGARRKSQQQRRLLGLFLRELFGAADKFVRRNF